MTLIDSCYQKVIQILRGNTDNNMLDKYTQFAQEYVRHEYMRAIQRLGVSICQTVPAIKVYSMLLPVFRCSHEAMSLLVLL